MTSPIDDELDAIATRALHDPDMRNILAGFGVSGSHDNQRSRMRDLSSAELNDLLSQSADLEERSGRSNQVYSGLSDFAKARWVELIRDANDQAIEIVKGMEPAMDTARSSDRDAYEQARTDLASKGQSMREAVGTATNTLRRDIRQVIAAGNYNLDTESRAPLVDHLTKSAPVPKPMADVMEATNRLEAAKAKHDMDLAQQRYLSPTPAPRATLDH